MPEVASQVFSLPGRLLQGFAEARKENKEFKDLVKRLRTKYTVKKLEKILNKYMKKPQKQREQLNLLIAGFEADFGKFTQHYDHFFENILAILKAAETEEYNELLEFKQLIELVQARAKEHPTEFYFPANSLKSFEKEFKKTLKDVARQLAEEYAEFSNAAKAKRWFAGFWSRFISTRTAQRKGGRSAQRLQKGVDVVAEVHQHLAHELKEGVQMDFLALLIQYLLGMRKLIDLGGDMKHDLAIIMQNINESAVEVIAAVLPFILYNRNNPSVAAALELLENTFKTKHAAVLAKIEQGAQWSRYLDSILKNIDKAETELLATLIGRSQREVTQEARELLGLSS